MTILQPSKKKTKKETTISPELKSLIDDYIAANEKYIEYIKPNEEEYNKTEKERGVTNEQLRELGIADSADGLTRREAQEILVLANARGVRGSSQRSGRDSGKDQGVAEASR